MMNSEKEKKVVSRKRKSPLDTVGWNIRRELNAGEERAPAKGPKKGCMQGKGGPENGKSNFRGVRQRQWGSWVAEIREPAGWGTKNRRVWLGSFKTAVEAAQAYNEAAKAMYGECASLNSVIPAPPTPSSVLSPLAETATPTTLDFRDEQVILLSDDDAMFGGEVWAGMEQGEEVEGVDEANFVVNLSGNEDAMFHSRTRLTTKQGVEVEGVEEANFVVNLSSNKEEEEEEVIEVTGACDKRLLYFEEEMKELDCYDDAIMFAREMWPEMFIAKFDDDASSSCEGELWVDDEETNGLWSCFL